MVRSALQRGRSSVLPHHCIAMPARGVSEPKAMAASAHLAGHVKVHEDDIKGVRTTPIQQYLIRFLTIKGTCHLQDEHQAVRWSAVRHRISAVLELT